MIAASGLSAASDTIIIKAVGTWGYFTNYQKHEGPFWNERIAEVSRGEIVGEILGGMKGNFGYNEISEFPIFCPSLLINLLMANCMIGITTNCGIGK